MCEFFICKRFDKIVLIGTIVMQLCVRYAQTTCPIRQDSQSSINYKGQIRQKLHEAGSLRSAYEYNLSLPPVWRKREK